MKEAHSVLACWQGLQNGMVVMGGDVAATAGLRVIYWRVQRSESCNNMIKSTSYEGKKELTYPILMTVLVCGQCSGMSVAGCTGRMPVAISSCNTELKKYTQSIPNAVC